MIISNVNVESTSKELEFGTIHQIILGESGRGRKELRLTCPENLELKKGCNFGLTITTTKSGKPRISKSNANNGVFLILSSKGGYTRRGNGWVGSWVKNVCEYTLLAKGNGADGDAGRIGQWDVVLLKAEGLPQCDWIRIRTGGGGYGTSPQWLAITAKGYFLFDETDDAIEFSDSVGYDFPNIENNVEQEFKDVTL